MIIGVCGFIGSGKNTVAEYLMNKYGFYPISFADTLKNMSSSLFGWDREMLEGNTPESRFAREQKDEWWSKKLGFDISPRYALQLMGTEVMRNNFHEDIWVIAAERKILQHNNVVISDVRFPNEMDMICQNGGQLWCVRRGPNPEWFDTAKNNPDKMGDLYPKVHSSEYIWVSRTMDFVIDNDSALEVLYKKIDDIIG
jgi:hypothetical protein